jgi:hypothetical protein
MVHPVRGIPWALNGSSKKLVSSEERVRKAEESPVIKELKGQRTKKVAFVENENLETVHYFDPFNGHVRKAEESIVIKRVKRHRAKKVEFEAGFKLEKVHCFDPFNGHEAPTNNGGDTEGEVAEANEQDTKLTEELSLLSTLHGRARRELRDISKHDLQTAMKYGIKTPGNFIKGEQRWKFEFGNTVFITDEHCTKEITSWKKAIKIEPAKITPAMLENHYEAVRVLNDDPLLVNISWYHYFPITTLKTTLNSFFFYFNCTTHSIIIVDQRRSMRNCDVNGFRSRSDAAYGTLALDYIAEQLYQQGDGFFVDAVTIIEMNDTGSVLFRKEPLDWVS